MSPRHFLLLVVIFVSCTALTTGNDPEERKFQIPKPKLPFPGGSPKPIVIGAAAAAANQQPAPLAGPPKPVLAAGAVVAAAAVAHRQKTQNTDIIPTKRSDGITVEIEQGKVKGYSDEARNGREYYGFVGMPYAKPPVGPLRFESPQAPEKFDEVKDATEYGEVCAQYDGHKKDVKGSEDCLFINVYTPRHESGTVSPTPFPVMVFIHGGDWLHGSANAYQPEYFMDHDVVLVTFNYRLASLGFLNTEDGLVRGNMGMKDQVQALKWVQQNIGKFGGDKDKVTLFGQSSGGGSVQYHLMSPMSKGLFHKGISMSGSAIKPFSLQPRPLEAAKKLAQKLNCSVETNEEMVTCLRETDVDAIMEAHYESKSISKDLTNFFGPSVEFTHKDQEDTFLTEHPYSILLEGKQANLPWMTGVNSEEGLVISGRIKNNKTEIEKINNEFDAVAPKYLVYDKTRTDITNRMKKFYLNESGEVDFENQFENFTNLFSDRFWMYPSHESIRVQSMYGPVWAYYNNYQGQATLVDLFDAHNNFPGFAVKKLGDLFKEKVLGQQAKHLGVCHMDDLPLFFKIRPVTIDKRHKDYQQSVMLVKLWVQFARDESKLQVQGTTWDKVEPGGMPIKYMQFINADRGTQGPIDEPMKNRMEFFDSLRVVPYSSDSSRQI